MQHACVRIEDDISASDVSVNIDLQCALVFGRTALRALVALSETAAVEVDRCIAEELAIVSLEAQRGAPAIEAILMETRELLKGRRRELERTRSLEDQIIQAAKNTRQSRA